MPTTKVHGDEKWQTSKNEKQPTVRWDGGARTKVGCRVRAEARGSGWCGARSESAWGVREMRGGGAEVRRLNGLARVALRGVRRGLNRLRWKGERKREFGRMGVREKEVGERNDRRESRFGRNRVSVELKTLELK